MKSKTKKRLGVPLFTVGLIIAVMVLFLLSYHVVNSLMSKAAIKRMREATRYTADRITMLYDNNSLTLSLIAEEMKNIDTGNGDAISALLKKYSANTTATRISAIFPNDSVYTKDGLIGSETDETPLLFNDMMEDIRSGIRFSRRDYSRYNQQELIVRQYKAVEKDGEIIAIVYAVYNCSEIGNEIDPKVYDGNAYIQVIDTRDGLIVADSLHSNLEDITINFIDGMKLKKGGRLDVSRILRGETGEYRFLSNTIGDYMLTSFAPTGYSEYVVVVNVPEKEAFSSVSEFGRFILVLGIIQLILFSCYSLWIARENKVDTEIRIKEETQRIELEDLKKAVKLEEERDEISIVLTAISENYDTLLHINFDTSESKVYRSGHALAIPPENWARVANYASLMREYANLKAIPEDVEKVLEETSISTVQNAFKNGKEHTVRFRSENPKDPEWIEIRFVRSDEINEKNCAIVGFRYITEEVNEGQRHQREVEAQREKMVAELERAKQLAEKANEAKTTFLFNMSHDIRTPMNAITGFTAMAKKYMNDSTKLSDCLTKIEVSSKQLLSLINQVLEMSRIEYGKVVLEEKPLDLTAKFASMVTVMKFQAESKGITLNDSIKNITHKCVYADQTRIGQINLNVLGNAIKYTGEGGTVEYSMEERSCSKEGYANYAFIVRDNGIGMSSEFLSRIYEPFAREQTSTVSQIQGTGLGMSIVKNLVTMMKGNVVIKSEQGKGSEFVITIPLRICDDKIVESTSADRVGGYSLAGKRVLLVEDNEMNREIAADILTEFGIILEEAEDGDIAVAKVESAEVGFYDFILMDVQMPRMNGYEATKRIREIPGGKGELIPIIAMTANAFEEDRKQAIEAGMDDHLAKPIDVNKMIETLTRHNI